MLEQPLQIVLGHHPFLTALLKQETRNRNLHQSVLVPLGWLLMNRPMASYRSCGSWFSTSRAVAWNRVWSASLSFRVLRTISAR